MGQKASKGDGGLIRRDRYPQQVAKGLIRMNGSLVKELHDRQGGAKRFGQGGQVKGRVLFHWERNRQQNTISGLFEKNDFFFLGSQQYRTGINPFLGPLFQEVSNGYTAFSFNSHFSNLASPCLPETANINLHKSKPITVTRKRLSFLVAAMWHRRYIVA